MRVHERVLAVQASLTGRDIRLMSWLYDHGVLTTPQIIDALFGSPTFGQRRLLRLLQLGVLTRFRPQKPDGGSYPYHWLLDQTGTEVIAAQRGDPLPRPGQARARRLQLTSRANLSHLLGVNGFFTALAAHQRTHPGASLEQWPPAAQLGASGAFYEHGDNLSVMSVRLRPDGHGLWIEDGIRVAFFFEHDTGTETQATLLHKVDRYQRLWLGKQHTNPVLFQLPTALREMHLHQRLADTHPPRGLPLATTSADLLATTGRSPAQHVWWVYRVGGARRRLVDLPGAHPAADSHPDPPVMFGTDPVDAP
jgi:hypothetical protein